MRRYLRNYGWHFTKKACEAAVSKMRKLDSSNKIVKLEAYSKEDVDALLAKHNVKLDNDVMYDSVFVANMAKADFLGRSVPDEQRLAMYVKDTLDDIDVADGVVMRRWYATALANGEPVDWEEMM